MRYVALGDSYTIGTSVEEAERWPNQLVARIGAIELAGNPAVNGYTSADLIADELPRLEGLRPQLASVLIGVNDVVRGVPEPQYAANVAIILEALLGRLPPGRIFCVATPDYTVTPQGAEYGDPARQSAAIVRVNAILGDACALRGVTFIQGIYEVSRLAMTDPELVAADGLHPSAKQYAAWVDEIAPVVARLLAED